MELSDPRKVRLLEWLTTPPIERSPRTQKELADELMVSPRTIRDWRDDDRFRRVWEKRAKEVAGDPERIQRVLNALFDAATDPQARDRVAAGKLYLESINAIKPPTVEVSVTRKLEELSDDELNAMIAKGAAELQAERSQS
jgi:transcriptional regulator with XRE-family HTH domain